MLKTLTPTATELITAWQAKKADAAVAVAAERDARAAAVAHIFADAPVGTSTLELTDGFKLKYVRSLNYTLDKTPVDENDPTGDTKLDVALEKLAHTGNDGAFVAERVVKWTPELSVGEYKKLTPAQRAVIDAVITTKDASPELKIEGPAK